MDLLLRRLTLWIVAGFSGFFALLFYTTTALLDHGLNWIWGGRPIPAITRLMIECGPFAFGIPILFTAIATYFSLGKKPTTDGVVLISVTFILTLAAIIVTSSLAATLPFIPFISRLEG